MANIIKLQGCSPDPLAHYLKALGVMRLVAEQADADVKGFWQNDRFFIETKLTQQELVDFFLYKYCPTPIVAPWNGGSGFYPNDNQNAIRAVRLSKSQRFSQYREVIEAGSVVLMKFKGERPGKEKKYEFLKCCRNEFPEAGLKWLDAAIVLTDNGEKYPSILGTGGNDGRLDFTNNFMQRLVELIDVNAGNPIDNCESYLKEALFTSELETKKQNSPIGQFSPGNTGGVNSTRGFYGASLINPWDYILMIEGTLMFASACSRKLNPESASTIVSPFIVETVAAGYASASLADEGGARGELWAPLWEKPSNIRELSYIFAEGRAEVGKRLARNGLDFARATATLGIHRGISSFQRFSFQERNGMAYFAIPLKRIITKRNERVDLLSGIDRWLTKFIGLRKQDTTPGAIKRVFNNLDDAILDLCQQNDPGHLQAVLIQLGRCEKAFSKSVKWVVEKGIEPLQGLSFEWVKLSYTNTPEFRLACSLASMSGEFRGEFVPVRMNLEPVNFDKFFRFNYIKEGSVKVVWHDGDFIDVLNKIFARRLIDAEKSGSGKLNENARTTADLDDIMKFINGETDDALLSDLLWGLSLIDWSGKEQKILPERDDFEEVKPEALYALMKLCFMKRPDGETSIPLAPAIHRYGSIGNGEEASKLAARRLRSSDMPPAVQRILLAGDKVRRMAAALLFPLNERDWHRLADAVLRPEEQQV
ncbi:MAG: type I-G CRISPR-associated protein Cas8g1/Csx17 [Verrucomicrobiia bacterium]